MTGRWHRNCSLFERIWTQAKQLLRAILKLRVLLFLIYPLLRGQAGPLDEWTWRNPLPAGNELYAVNYGANRFVAVGELGTIVSSPDGDHWTFEQSGSSATLLAVCHGNNRFIAVGKQGTILGSMNGSTWSQQIAPVIEDLIAVAYGHDTFVILGKRSVLVSSNGVDWIQPQGVSLTGAVSITYANDLFVAVGSTRLGGVSEPHSRVFTSTDGLDWAEQVAGDNFIAVPAAVVYGNGTFVAVGGIPVRADLLISHDGVTWEQGFPGSQPLAGAIAFGAGIFAAVGQWSDGPLIITSDDGVAWTQQTDSLLDYVYKLNGISYGAGRFVAVGSYGAIISSSDGIIWSRTSTGPRVLPLLGATSRDGTFIAVGGVACCRWDFLPLGTVVRSTNTAVWTQSATFEFPLMGIASGKGKFVAVGGDINGAKVITSPEGLVWTMRSLDIASALQAVAFGNESFVAVGNDGAIWSSADGEIWIQRDSGTDVSLRAIAFSGTEFVVVGYYGMVLTSADAVVWTKQKSGGTLGLTSIAFGNGIFVAGTAGGPRGTILTSTDGRLWTPRFLSGTKADIYGVFHGHGIFLAVGQQDFADSPFGLGIILSSSDGLTWTNHPTRIGYGLTSIALVPHGFIVAGNNSVILQSGALSTPFDILRFRSGETKRDADGTVHLVVEGPVGLDIILEASSDLNSWGALQTTANPTGVVAIDDSSAVHFGQRFYRAKQQLIP